jgi:hypothetical protein
MTMDTDLLFETIRELRLELARVNQAIVQVEALMEGRARRGRPPKAFADAQTGFEAEVGRLLPGRRHRRRGATGDNDG